MILGEINSIKIRHEAIESRLGEIEIRLGVIEDRLQKVEEMLCHICIHLKLAPPADDKK